jgi:hypothetical protein
MTDLRLSAHELEDVLAGRQPGGRADLAPLAEVAAVLHASREVEPPPPISDSLRAQIDGGVTRQAATTSAVRPRRHRPRHMQAAPPSDGRAASYRRPVVSLAAAAVLLVGLVLATSREHLPGDVHSAVADMGDAIGLDMFRSDDAARTDEPAPTTTSSTTTTTAAPTTTVPPPSTTAPPTTQAPAGPPSDSAQLPWWLQPEAWQQFGFDQWDDGRWGDGRGDDYSGDGDHDGDGGGDGSGDGGDGMPPSDSGSGDTTTLPSTAVAPTSTSTSPSSSTTGPTDPPQ